MVAGQAVSGGSAPSSAASTRRRRASRRASVPAVSASPVPAGERRLLRAAGGVGGDLAPRVLEEQLDLALRLLELGGAEPRQPDPLLVEDQGLLQRQVPLLELLHDLVELEQGGLEARRLLAAHSSSLPVTRAASAPERTRMRRGSPTATPSASRTRRPE